MPVPANAPHWFENIAWLLSGGGLGAIILSLLKKPWTKPEQEALSAVASKDRSAGQADLLVAVTTTFKDVTGGLREEIERLQTDAGELRQRAVQFESELKLALQRVDDLERLVAEKDAIIARQQADLERVRAERDLYKERVVQQEGEIRQLKQLLESKSKLTDG